MLSEVSSEGRGVGFSDDGICNMIRFYLNTAALYKDGNSLERPRQEIRDPSWREEDKRRRREANQRMRLDLPATEKQDQQPCWTDAEHAPNIRQATGFTVDSSSARAQQGHTLRSSRHRHRPT